MKKINKTLSNRLK